MVVTESSQFSLVYPDEKPIDLEVKYPELLHLYQEAKNRFWLPQEVKYDVDALEWTTILTDDERHLLSRILAFLAAAHSPVDGNIIHRFYTDVKMFEAKYFYDLQIAAQNIHAECLSRALESVVKDRRQRFEVLNLCVMHGNLAEHTRWVRKWLQRSAVTYGERLVAYACSKAIFFRSSFAVMESMQVRGIMPGLRQLAERMVRDTTLHGEFACLVWKHREDIPLPSIVHKMVGEAVKIEIKFIEDAFSHIKLSNLSAEDLGNFVKFVADQTLRSLGYEVLFGAENMLSFSNWSCRPILTLTESGRKRATIKCETIVEETEPEEE
ncbi:hypothetical protein NMY22_g11903 [Coprinellus aureogranulatus]|nr:hypothetical protein NMY22_g11903 [Coprinellus aureogranulatus]